MEFTITIINVIKSTHSHGTEDTVNTSKANAVTRILRIFKLAIAVRSSSVVIPCRHLTSSLNMERKGTDAGKGSKARSRQANRTTRSSDQLMAESVSDRSMVVSLIGDNTEINRCAARRGVTLSTRVHHHIPSHHFQCKPL